MADCVSEYGRLESIGWKAQGGTGINENNTQGRFYGDFCEHFSAAGEAIVFQLLLDGKVVASDLCLFRNGMLVVLKTTYDEKVEKLSPALLMRREIVRELHASSQIRVVEL
jgi:Acetyltransferase (GNAT) domain